MRTLTRFTPRLRQAAALFLALAFVAPGLAFADDQTDLSVTMSVDNAAPDVGGQVVFTLTANNAGPNDDINVVVDDALPTGLTFVSASGDGSYDSNAGTWSIGNLTHGASATLALTATVTSSADLDATINTATISGGKTDPNPSNDSASVSLNPQNADVSITNAVDTTTPAEGANVTYTLTATNHGDTARTVVGQDSLPAGLTFASATGDGTFDSGTGVWTIGDLADSASATLTLTASVDASTTGSSIVNTATVTSDTYDPEPGNNSASAPAVTPGAIVVVTPPSDSGNTASSTDSSDAVAPPTIDHQGGGGPGCSAGMAWNPSANRCVAVGQVLGASTSVPSACSVVPTGSLSLGMRGAAVMQLQQFLVAHGYGSFAATGYYGPLTEQAVKAFQLAYASSILTPLGLTQPTGAVYRMTLGEWSHIACGA